jgi:clan AA aspartic protease
MIAGVVEGREALILLTVRAACGDEIEIEAVIDMGFTGTLTLPPAVVAELGLTWKTVGKGTLADGSECALDVYNATVLWDGQPKKLLVMEADATPLVGMTLMFGYLLTAEIWRGGKVTLKKRPPKTKK